MCYHANPDSEAARKLEEAIRDLPGVGSNIRMLTVNIGKEFASVMADFDSPEKIAHALNDLQRWHPGATVSSRMEDYIIEQTPYGKYYSDVTRAQKTLPPSTNPSFDGHTLSPKQFYGVCKTYGYI